MFLLQVVNSLEKQRVRYALVGGHAVALHGAVRGTIDLDFVIQLDEKSFKSAEQALLDIGLKSHLPVTAENIFQFREEYIKNKNLIAWSFVNPNHPIEIVDIIITEDLKKMKTVTKKIAGKNIHLASIPDLITMKLKSNRAQDREDIKALEKLK
ncbi:hypothetical protein MNBD_NITROSPIRAE01-1055 [hydrothermal vent metagenome]|uniref:DUF6036 domain-containing protein n=1 Tax=hydrothermal vent metagenome TaxID=652676 RepID=A0A3B1CKS6_9ZZZZ